MNSTQPKTIASWPALFQPEPAWATDSLLLRFATRVHEPSSGCWEWQGGKDKDGYGKIYSCGEHMRTHRVAYRLYKGEIPDGLHVCHTCDNPSCVNPAHLWLGTNDDNMDDMNRKARNPRIKYTVELVEAIRKARADHGTPYNTLGEQFGVSGGMAYHICNDPNYRKHVVPLEAPAHEPGKPGMKVHPPEVVEAVREARAKYGTPYRELGEQFGMSGPTAYRLCNNPDYRREDAPLAKPVRGGERGNVKYGPEVIEAVRAERAAHGTSYEKLGEKYGVNGKTAWNFCNDPNYRKSDAPVGGSDAGL